MQRLLSTHRGRGLAAGLFLGCLLPLCLPAHGKDTPDPFAPVRARMQTFVDQQDVAGAVTVVGRKDGVLSIDAVGKLDLDKETPMPKDALFRIASMTKPITAIGIMILVDEGKLAVNDPVEKHLPEFRGQMLAVKDGDTITLKKPSRPITVRDLLTHTSGLPGALPPGLTDLYVKRNHTLAEAVMVFSQRPLDFEPGTKWAYCNPGIDTLGRIIEVVSGQSYEDFLEKRIFKPLGMTDTTFYPSAVQLVRAAPTYAKKDGKLVPAANTVTGPPEGARYPIPAGGLYSTGADLARLYRMMLNGGTLDKHRILSAKSVKEMTKVQTGDVKVGFTPGSGWGLGWSMVTKPEGVTKMLSPGSYGHGGAYGTQAWIDPEKDLFVVLLIQRSDLGNSDGSRIRQEFQEAAVAAVPPKPKEVFTDANDPTMPADFKIQGEYAGEIKGSGKVGCQVIALGKGTFQAVLLPGGLPGEGWDGKDKILMAGQLNGDRATFTPATGQRKYLAQEPDQFSATSKFPPTGQKDYTATIAGDTLTGKTDEGVSFELKKVVRKSTTLGAKPPEGAVVLFDGTNTDAWNGGGRLDKATGFLNTDGHDITTKQKFNNYTAHVEFLLPYRPDARGQGRGNSGFYQVDHYEVQILDSFGLDGKDNECGGVYTKIAPKVNMCLPPLVWQTYDVEFSNAVMDDGKKVKNARITVKHNGVVIIDDKEISGPTGGHRNDAEGTPGPLKLQGHGNPLQFRNVWVVEKK
jgi:CubicO group peptidase (beta-lactamase class C family)